MELAWDFKAGNGIWTKRWDRDRVGSYPPINSNWVDLGF